MDQLNVIFSAYFSIVPYDFFVGIMAAVFCVELVLTITQFWDII